jgi:hypothetical protein
MNLYIYHADYQDNNNLSLTAMGFHPRLFKYNPCRVIRKNACRGNALISNTRPVQSMSFTQAKLLQVKALVKENIHMNLFMWHLCHSSSIF